MWVIWNFFLFVLICEALFVIFILLFTHRQFKSLLKINLKECMTAFWTWVEMALLGLSWTSIVLYFIRFGLGVTDSRRGLFERIVKNLWISTISHWLINCSVMSMHFSFDHLGEISPFILLQPSYVSSWIHLEMRCEGNA